MKTAQTSISIDIWQAIINPARSVEAKAWVNRFPTKARELRGPRYGETLMHWASISDMGLVIDLMGHGLDINASDNMGRTPLDWISERLWFACVENMAALGEEGRRKLLAQTEEIGIVVWQNQGRPGMVVTAPLNHQPTDLFFGTMWTRGGAWSLLKNWYSADSLDVLMNWGLRKKTVLHDWILAPESATKEQFLIELLDKRFSVDAPDCSQRTPLWYAVDAWLAHPEHSYLLEPSIKSLLQHSADPDFEDGFGFSPFLLFDEYDNANGKKERFESWIVK